MYIRAVQRCEIWLKIIISSLYVTVSHQILTLHLLSALFLRHLCVINLDNALQVICTQSMESVTGGEEPENKSDFAKSVGNIVIRSGRGDFATFVKLVRKEGGWCAQ